MADYRAITAVCKAVIELLEKSWGRAPGDVSRAPEFRVLSSQDFASTSGNRLTTGVSLFLYRIFPDAAVRAPARRPTSDGPPTPPQLPVELHFLLTAWGENASDQQLLAGWMLRTLEDQPILSAEALNDAAPGVARPDETVRITLNELTHEELLRVWEMLAVDRYELSLPYIARGIGLESIEGTLPVITEVVPSPRE